MVGRADRLRLRCWIGSEQRLSITPATRNTSLSNVKVEELGCFLCRHRGRKSRTLAQRTGYHGETLATLLESSTPKQSILYCVNESAANTEPQT